jgi:hypothetical protein
MERALLVKTKYKLLWQRPVKPFTYVGKRNYFFYYVCAYVHITKFYQLQILLVSQKCRSHGSNIFVQVTLKQGDQVGRISPIVPFFKIWTAFLNSQKKTKFLGYILGDFFANSTGHRASLCYF